MIDLSCDYNVGCAPELMAALAAANGTQHATYGFDACSARAKEKIRAAVGNAEADVFFLVGGTQTNATVLAAILRPWEGVISAASGHIAVHESGAVEATGHKVLTLEADEFGRLDPGTLRAYLRSFYADPTYTHMAQPGAVYLSHPTELGGLYTAGQLREIRALCGEAVVFREKQPHFFPAHKQRGALLAKGFLLGIQFDALFTDDLYLRLGKRGAESAAALREGLRALGVPFSPESASNQQFPVLTAEQLEKLGEKIRFEIWQSYPDGSALVRLCTSWRTTADDVDAVLEALK